MAVFNAAKREIDLKIVYYGPAMCGKTTNVQCIHKMLAPQQRGELMSLATKDDRTLFFDFLPIELGDVRGFKTRFHIYTVPGQVYYALTRRAVLTGADGVVFVVDSQSNKLQENIESLKDLSENLRFYKKDLSVFPFVLQYNKRDLPNIMPTEELNAMLNTLNVPALESSAVTGMGVVETLTTICKIVLKQMDSGTAKKKPPQPAARQAERPAMKDDDSGLRIFAQESAAMPPQPSLSSPQRQAAAPAAGLKPDDATSKNETPPQEDFSDVMIEESPGAPAEPELAFDDEGPAGLDIEEPAAEPELAFDDEGPLDLDIEEPAAEPELAFDDEG
ncbi:MAG: GTPase domain-containing protein, partial [Deltaproteobacteria bacterium]|nr:GTPase domain-containing protein [Deltaproteobacteria bacterium]